VIILKVDKKGQSLSMNTIIISILVILVLVIVAGFFAGGMTGLINKMKGIFGAQPIDASQAVMECNGYCQSYDITGVENYKTNFCGDVLFDLDTDNDGKMDTSKTCSQLGVICQTIIDEGGC